MKKIAILKWEEGKVPKGLMQLETLIGNSTNEKSYNFPVRFVPIKGACVETIITNPSDELLQNIIKASKKLINEEGIQAISTSCGFNAIFQKEMTNNLDVPVFTSALLQIPFIQNLIGSENYVGVITANKSSLTKEHFKACGITDDMNINVIGLENANEWSKIFTNPNNEFDIKVVTEEILEVAIKCVKNNPRIKAIVLECTDLPPFAKQIREAVNLPVFDYISMMNYVEMSIDDY